MCESTGVGWENPEKTVCSKKDLKNEAEEPPLIRLSQFQEFHGRRSG